MALEEIERPKAAERKAQAPGEERGSKKVSSENFTGETKGDTRDIVGSAVGMSGVTYGKAKKVVQKADEGDAVAREALTVELQELQRLET